MLGFANPPMLEREQYHEKAAAKRLGIDGFVGRRGTFSVPGIKNAKDRLQIAQHALRYPLLLSMCSEGTTQAMWSDAGTLYILCHDEELAARNFAQIPTFIYH